MSLRPMDQKDRDLAITTFDQNIVVTAGAGTGKTTLLINRLLHLLMREPGAILVTQIVALTFTNKSANEMKTRLRAALEQLINEDADAEKTAALMNQYGFSKDQLNQRAVAAIRDLERSDIGTIHHFAGALLRLYPIETGVDPLFQIDEGGRQFERRFKTVWQGWLERELSTESPRKTAWQEAFARHALYEIEAFAKMLVSETLPLASLKNDPSAPKVPLPIQAWLKTLETAAEDLLNAHPENRKIENMLAAAKTLFCAVREKGNIEENTLEAEQQLIASSAPGKVKGWEEDEFKEAGQLIKIAKQCLQIDSKTLTHLLALLSPFITLFHEHTRQEGWLSFDALLVKARNLLRDRPGIREALKFRYHAILIDEFQDTDPVQYEILLYLAEQPNTQSNGWQDVELVPGKLFVVGDPKQSIYGFRRADIEAYHAVREMILRQNGIHCTLRTNFRSHKKILDAVNGVLKPLMLEKPGIQPEYIPIVPAPPKTDIGGSAADKNPFRGVSFRPFREDTANAETAKQQEGEAITQWLSASVLDRAEIVDADGTIRRVQKGDVAILMRSLTGIHYILEPLRRAGIRYRVEGERHFYRNSVVNDAINLLRTVADPNDRIALVGLLRSPLGGLTDDDIYALHLKKQLNYRSHSTENAIFPPVVQTLYPLLRQLHEDVAQLPPGNAVAHIFEATPLHLLAAATPDGEQALANLNKLVGQAAQLAEADEMSFRAVVEVFKRAVLDDIDEPESPLAEEGVDAVKIFSIHKAKGLEFPVVILAGCQTGPAEGERERAIMHHDWSTNLIGLRIGDCRDLASVFLSEKTRLREIEEEKRILYVAMTRAREHLIFSAAFNGRLKKGSILAHLQTAMGESETLLDEHSGPLAFGEGTILKHVFSEIDRTSLAPKIEIPPQVHSDFTSIAQEWEGRFKTCETIQNTPVFTSPTQLKNETQLPFIKTEAPTGQSGALTDGTFIGQLAHQFLETWDFSGDVQDFPVRLRAFIKQQDFRETDLTMDMLLEEMDIIFQVFFHSKPYLELAQATILGREIPFLMPWKGQVLKGTIDLLYEKEGQLYIADYKTDRIQKEDIEDAALNYQHQLRIYPEAVKHALKREVAGMKLIFLRLGISFESDA